MGPVNTHSLDAAVLPYEELTFTSYFTSTKLSMAALSLIYITILDLKQPIQENLK